MLVVRIPKVYEFILNTFHSYVPNLFRGPQLKYFPYNDVLIPFCKSDTEYLKEKSHKIVLIGGLFY